MKYDAYGKLNFIITGTFIGPFMFQTKFPDDEIDHEYGQWTSRIEVISNRVTKDIPALLSFLVKTPNDLIEPNQILKLYRGTTQVCTFLVIGDGLDHYILNWNKLFYDIDFNEKFPGLAELMILNSVHNS